MTAVSQASADAVTLDGDWSRLTRNPDKWRLYCEEPGFMVAQASLLAELGPGALDCLSGCAMLLVKPEGWIEGILPRVLNWLARNEFEIVQAFRTELSPIAMHEVWRYSWNIGPVERIVLSELLLSLGPAYGFLLKDRRQGDGTWASTRLASMKGPSRPDQQRAGQLRCELRTPSRVMSYVHIPDEPADMVRDMSLLLDRQGMVRLIARSADTDGAPCDISPADFGDVSYIDRSLFCETPCASAAGSLMQQLWAIRGIFARYRLDGNRYGIPPALWRELLVLAAAISELPTTGTKLIEPLAEIAS
jgi:hypothetical protein